ncbi:hypothetical protein AKO1_006441, partial [Acrasis kona]
MKRKSDAIGSDQNKKSKKLALATVPMSSYDDFQDDNQGSQDLSFSQEQPINTTQDNFDSTTYTYNTSFSASFVETSSQHNTSSQEYVMSPSTKQQPSSSKKDQQK